MVRRTFLLSFSTAEVKPVAEIPLNFLFKELNFLFDVENLPQLDEDAVDGVEGVGVGASCGPEVCDDHILEVLATILLPVFDPLH